MGRFRKRYSRVVRSKRKRITRKVTGIKRIEMRFQQEKFED